MPLIGLNIRGAFFCASVSGLARFSAVFFHPASSKQNAFWSLWWSLLAALCVWICAVHFQRIHPGLLLHMPMYITILIRYFFCYYVDEVFNILYLTIVVKMFQEFMTPGIEFTTESAEKNKNYSDFSKASIFLWSRFKRLWKSCCWVSVIGMVSSAFWTWCKALT